MSILPNQIALTSEQRERLARLAEETGRPWGELLDEALAAYQPHPASPNGQEGESFFDRASRLGLIGCVEGGPPDLSTNPKYMEGFGESES
jgi:hypothetical protein